MRENRFNNYRDGVLIGTTLSTMERRKSHGDLIMSDCDYERSRMSNITLCATYTIYRRFLGKFPRLDTADRTSWNFAWGEVDAERGHIQREVRSRYIESPRAARYTQLVRARSHASTLIPPNFRSIYSHPTPKHIFPSLLDCSPAFAGSSTRRRGGEPRKERTGSEQ